MLIAHYSLPIPRRSSLLSIRLSLCARLGPQLLITARCPRATFCAVSLLVSSLEFKGAMIGVRFSLAEIFGSGVKIERKIENSKGWRGEFLAWPKKVGFSPLCERGLRFTIHNGLVYAPKYTLVIISTTRKIILNCRLTAVQKKRK